MVGRAHPLTDVLREPLVCATCGSVLIGDDPDEDPAGDAGLPICGECARARHFDVLDIIDGDRDGRIGGR